MLKFDERNAPEDANWPPPGNDFYELMNSKPSQPGLQPTKGTRYNVLGKV